MRDHHYPDFQMNGITAFYCSLSSFCHSQHLYSDVVFSGVESAILHHWFGRIARVSMLYLVENRVQVLPWP